MAAPASKARSNLALLVIAGATCALGSTATAASAESHGARTSVDPRTLPLVREVDERFQSFQIGMSHLTGGETWKAYDPGEAEGASPQAKDFSGVRETRAPTDLTNVRLRTMASALGPFYVRYGGTTSNSVYFQRDDEAPLRQLPKGFQTVLTASAWKGAIAFATAVGAKIVTGFTVSDGVRDPTGLWTPKMAEPWLKFTQAVGGSIYAAELFNEPNAPEPGRMPEGQSAENFAKDFAIFSAFSKQAAPSLKLAGPGVAMLGVPIPMPSLEKTSAAQYMAAYPSPRFDIVSYHFYGAVAERCAAPNSPAGLSAEMALSEEWLARPDKKFQEMKVLRDRYAPEAPIWLTETGAAACGGPRWQPTFLDTFRFVDTQARLAKQGLDVIITHALISGSNGIIDEKSLAPNANYWPAVLWAKLVGTKVLDAGPIQPGIHVYAHCQRGVSGGVALIVINTRNTGTSLSSRGKAHVYALTAPELQSATVLLNDRPLRMQGDTALPELRPTSVDGEITIAPYSVNFIAVPKADNPACK